MRNIYIQDLFKVKLDFESGVPLYRQLSHQILIAIASGALAAGDQLPAAHKVAPRLSVNPNTVVRAYKELEVRGVLVAQQGTGTFMASRKITTDEMQRQRRLTEMVSDFLALASMDGYEREEVIDRLIELRAASGRQSRRPQPPEPTRVDRRTALEIKRARNEHRKTIP